MEENFFESDLIIHRHCGSELQTLGVVNKGHSYICLLCTLLICRSSFSHCITQAAFEPFALQRADLYSTSLSLLLLQPMRFGLKT